jgi:hypothetical protein
LSQVDHSSDLPTAALEDVDWLEIAANFLEE